MYKELIDILKIKLIFFSTLVGGSFGYFLSVKNNFILVLLMVLIILGSVGIIKTLYQLGKLYNEIKERNERNT